MKRALVLGLLLLSAGLAGCAGEEGTAEGDAETASSPSSPSPSAEDETNQTASPTDGEGVGLQAPPAWSPGAWWQVEIQDSTTDETYTLRRVVAAIQADNYRVGMPADAFSHPAVVSHFPGLGVIDARTLGFSVHGEPFTPLSFPLTEGQTWSTTLYEQDLEAEVVETDGETARVEMREDDDEEPTVTLTYDTSTRAISAFEGPLGSSMQVVDHGQGFEGEVRVPHDREQHIDGRFVGAFDLMFEPAPPSGTLTVSDRHEEASFAQIVGSIPFGTPAQPGYYRETTTDPAGQTTETTSLQAEGGLTVHYGSSQQAAGEWTFEHVAGGVGAAATELIVYQTQTVELPADTNATTEPT